MVERRHGEIESMRIALLSSSLSRTGGGIFDVVRRTGQLLNATGTKVSIFGFEDSETARDLPSWLPLIPQAFVRRGPAAFSISASLLSTALSSDAELLHVHGLWQYPSITSLLWTRKTGRPHMSTPHGMLDEWAVRRSGWKKKLAARAFERANLEEAACIHALCIPEARSIRHFGISAPICVIPNGVDLPSCDVDETAQCTRRRAEINNVLYLGRLHPKKGLADLLRGWAIARAALPAAASRWVLTIAGWDQGGYEDELRSLARDLHLNDVVRFAGPQFGDAKARAYATAHAFVLPSLSEGVPMAVLEAWAYRLPALITPECNLPEAYEEQAAVRIETTPASIAAGFEALWKMEPEERTSIGENGRKLVEQKFTWDVAVGQLLGVYEWILGRAKTPSVLYPD